jgi:hypothetical protein
MEKIIGSYEFKMEFISTDGQPPVLRQGSKAYNLTMQTILGGMVLEIDRIKAESFRMMQFVPDPAITAHVDTLRQELEGVRNQVFEFQMGLLSAGLDWVGGKIVKKGKG